MRFTSLSFINERNVTVSRSVVDLTCTVVHYANLSLSSINKPFSNYGLSNIQIFLFFDLLFQ